MMSCVMMCGVEESDFPYCCCKLCVLWNDEWPLSNSCSRYCWWGFVNPGHPFLLGVRLSSFGLGFEWPFSFPRATPFVHKFDLERFFRNHVCWSLKASSITQRMSMNVFLYDGSRLDWHILWIFCFFFQNIYVNVQLIMCKSRTVLVGEKDNS
jgi:hypothetical protein